MSLTFIRLFFAAGAIAFPPVEWTKIDGQTDSGVVTAIRPQVAKFRGADDESIEVDLRELLKIEFPEVSRRNPSPLMVRTSGGSRLPVRSVLFDGTNWAIQRRIEDDLELPATELRSVRFTNDQTTQTSWLGLLEREHAADILVIRRPGGVLDTTEGVVKGVTADAVEFDLDGTIIQAPITRLEGILMGGVKMRPASKIQIESLDTALWSVISIEGTDNRDDEKPEVIALRLASGTLHRLPLKRVAKISLSSGVTWLDEMKVASRELLAPVSGDADARESLPEVAMELFSPHASEADGGTKSDVRRMLFVGGTSVEYRLEESHQRFAGSWQRAKSVTTSGEVEITIAMDDQVVWQETLDRQEGLGFDLPIEGARRLSISVRSDGPFQAGSMVELQRGRLNQ